MRDLTDRALDTAAKLGATYADVRVIRPPDESIPVKKGRVGENGEGREVGSVWGHGLVISRTPRSSRRRVRSVDEAR